MRERIRAMRLAMRLDRGGLVGLAALLVYVWFAPHHVIDGDNAELAALSASGGAAHPSGYPLFVLWLRATSWLPGATTAHTAALSTAVLGAAAIVMLHAAARAWGAHALAASASVAVVACAPMVLRMHSEAEVFALNNLAVATMTWLAAPGAPLRGARRVIALALVAGLALGNHMTCVLVAPLGLFGVAIGLHEARSRVVVAAVALGAFALGLSSYLYLLVAPSTPMSWGEVRDVHALLDHILRRDYGGPGAFMQSGVEVSLVDNLGELARSLARAWWWVLPLVGLATLVVRCIRAGDRTARWGWIALATSWILMGPVLASRFDVELDVLGRYVVQRFHLLPTLVLAIPVAVGMTELVRWLARGRSRSLPRAVTVLPIIVLALATVRSASYVRAVTTPAVERGVSNLLNALPKDAVLFLGADDLHFGIIYAQSELGVRPDIVAVNWSMSGLPWYRERLERRGLVFERGARDGQPPSVRTAARLLAQGRAVYADLTQANLRSLLPSYPYAGVIRLVASPAQLPPLDSVVAENREAFGRFVLDYPMPAPDDEYPAVVHSRYASTWRALADALERSGRRDDASEALGIAAQLAPSE